MLILLSPAKRQDFEKKAPTKKHSQFKCKGEMRILLDELKKFDVSALRTRMALSKNLGELNYQRIQQFDPDKFSLANAKQALFAFQGDAYRTLAADDFDDADIDFAQEHLFILSGFYGLLRPLDLIQPYRLEMKTRLRNPAGRNLYQFWTDTLTNLLNAQLEKQSDDVIINLASTEYFKALDTDKLKGTVVNIDFKEKQNGSYKTVGVYAKPARGYMLRYLIKHKVSDLSVLKHFKESGYVYSPAHSSPGNYVFIRDHE